MTVQLAVFVGLARFAVCNACVNVYVSLIAGETHSHTHTRAHFISRSLVHERLFICCLVFAFRKQYVCDDESSFVATAAMHWYACDVANNFIAAGGRKIYVRAKQERNKHKTRKRKKNNFKRMSSYGRNERSRR